MITDDDIRSATVTIDSYGRDSALVRLAELLSPASRIGPELIRWIRVFCVPEADVSVEQELWFSDLVRSRGDEMLFADEVVAVLRSRLGDLRATDPAVVNQAKLWMDRIQVDLPPVLRLQEELGWAEVLGESKTLLAGAEQLADSVAAERDGVDHWLAAAWDVLPEQVRHSSAGRNLSQVAAMRGASIEATDPADLDATRVAHLLPKAHVFLNRQGRLLHIGLPADEASYGIEVAITEPPIVRLMYTRDGSAVVETVPLGAGVITSDVGLGAVTLVSVDGTAYALDSVIATGVHKDSQEPTRSMQIQVRLDGEPLRHAFVSHTPDFENPIIALTDDTGLASIEGVKPTDRIDIVVHAQNLAIRMLDGTKPGVAELSLRFRNKTDGSILNISKANKTRFDHFLIMDRCYDVYETVFRPIPPFSGSARRQFPFGGPNVPAAVHKREPPIDCRFPETVAPGKLPWVQPQSLLSGVPLMYLKSQSTDARLFGSPTQKATSIPHEYAHAIHFASLSKLDSMELAFRYGAWITKELVNGGSGTHRTNKATDPLIAFVESFGVFSQRFWFFAKEARPDLTGSRLRAAFVEDELSSSPALAKILAGYTPIASRSADGGIRPKLTGAETEGAVYGAIFLDFASRTDLATAVNLFLRCATFDFSGYAELARKQRSGQLKDDIDAVAETWRM